MKSMKQNGITRLKINDDRIYAPNDSIILPSFIASITSFIVYSRSTTLYFHDLANVNIESLVTPGNIVPFNGAVISSFSPDLFTQ